MGAAIPGGLRPQTIPRRPAGSGFSRLWACEAGSAPGRPVGQRQDSPPRLAQQSVGRVAPAQADYQPPGVAHHPSGQANHPETNCF